MSNRSELALRWIIGAVSAQGFQALQLSLWGAHWVFGPYAEYVVTVNSISAAEARTRTGRLPCSVTWMECDTELPDFLLEHVDAAMAQGVAWKFVPPRLFPDRYEIAFDNDCIIWAMPHAIRDWFLPENSTRCIVAQDVLRMLGKFDEVCGPGEFNAGIRGYPPGFDYEAALREVLCDHPVQLTTELDEQGLQAVAMTRHATPLTITIDDVTICSPFPSHRQALGHCGAHFVGLNSHALGWNYFGRPATQCTREHWAKHRRAIAELAGLPMGVLTSGERIESARPARVSAQQFPYFAGGAS